MPAKKNTEPVEKDLPLADLSPHDRNYNFHTPEQIKKLIESLKTFGQVRPIVTHQGTIIAGHGVYQAAQAMGYQKLRCTVLPNNWTEVRALAYLVADNETRRGAQPDDEQLAALIDELRVDFNGLALGFTDEDIEMLLASLDPDSMSMNGNESEEDDDPPLKRENAGIMFEKFVVPPFSVFDTRQHYWQERKKTWLSLGIQSEVGRDEHLLYTKSSKGKKKKGLTKTIRRIARVGTTSVFDPVICEIVYRWFMPPGQQNKVIDPFAGGSVRGIVAGWLGHHYTGIDLSELQIEANREQARTIITPEANESVTDPDALTPVEWYGDIAVKRDDLFTFGGVCGGKVRSCLALAEGAEGLVTSGSRYSPQVNIVAHVAAERGIPCHVHTPQGELSPEVKSAQQQGAEVIQHQAGYNNVIIARSRKDAVSTGWTEIPFGMECQEAITQTRQQVANIPQGIERIVIPVGSGMSLAGVLWGLKDQGMTIPVIGVVVGAEPTERLNAYAPPDWESMVELVPSGSEYHEDAPDTFWNGIALDPHYEAKCVQFIEPGDLFWIVGIRETARKPSLEGKVVPDWIVGDSSNVDTLAPGEYDLVFSCPPYANLEKYSDNPLDLSTMKYHDFIETYRAIIAKSVAMLKENRFAIFVVGEVRDNKGVYYNFVGDTIRAFLDAGMQYYNEGIILNVAGTVPIRASSSFPRYRKLGKTHQNLLIFYKGDVKDIKEYGDVEVGSVNFDGVETELIIDEVYDE